MSNAEEKIFPSKWFLYTFLGTTAIALFYSVTFLTGWIMWIFPAYIYLWSKGLQNKNRGLRKQG